MVDNNRTENAPPSENTQKPYSVLSRFITQHSANRPITVFPVDGSVGAGKTKVVQRLITELNKQGVSPVVIETDWFLKSRQEIQSLSPEEHSDLRNWFSTNELIERLAEVLKGKKETVSVKLNNLYSHATGSKTYDHGVLEINALQNPVVIILEGFASASPSVIDYVRSEEALGGVIWISTPEEICLERQLKRLEKERMNRDVLKQTELHQNIFAPTVQRHYQAIKDNIDIIVDNTSPSIEQIRITQTQS